MTFFAIITLYRDVAELTLRDPTIGYPVRRGYKWDGRAYHRDQNCFSTREQAEAELHARRLKEIEHLKSQIEKLTRLVKPGW